MSPGDHKLKNAARRASQAFRTTREPEPPAAPPTAPPIDPVGEAIETLRATPIAEIQRRGWHFQQRDFYSALNDFAFLEANPDLWHDRPMPAGIDWDLDGEIAKLRQIAPFAAELADVPEEMPEGPPRFHWRNNFWTGLDAFSQYCLMRDVKPRRVVEIGCGWSSLLLAQALAKNEAEGASKVVVDQVEPYPRTELLRALPDHWNLHEAILQRAPLEPFEALEAGDVCFYDGSHVVKPGSDVVWFFAEVLPRLRPGVLIHLHDVFFPREYPDEWIFDRGQTWNEQYVLQTFLMYNSDFKPLLCNPALMHFHHVELDELFSAVAPVAGSGSIWLRRVAG
ncbi:MAG TPA: class I SAM-dependent methyltransferase [Solirubrobacterales bacterium]